MTVPQMYALLFLSLLALALVMLLVAWLTARGVGSVKFHEGYNQCKALMSREQAQLEAENLQLRRKVHQLGGNETRVYALLGDGRPQLPAGYHLAKDPVRKGKSE